MGIQKPMGISFDPAKQAATLEHRGLDFADAGLVFVGNTATIQDVRHAYGEDRFVSAGYLRDRMVVVAWTPRSGVRHVISMRYCHANEERAWRRRMG
jgi:uncharacterized protein